MSKRLHKLSVLIYIPYVLLFAILFSNPNQLVAQCNALTDVGGTVFRELPASDPSTANTYGFRDANEPAMSGIFITSTDANGVVQNDTTDASGAWDITPATFPVRLEFYWNDSFLEASVSGNTNNTAVRIISAADCGVNLGVHYPEDYCQLVPEVTTSCYVSGDPLASGSTAGIDAIVSFPYNQTGDVTVPDKDALMSDVGAIWGMAYQRYKEEAYAAAIMKRHVGLGTQGIGGIYRISYAGGTVSVSSFMDLSALGVDVGTEPTRVLSADYDAPATDSLMFDKPGNIGLGDIDISADGNTLYVANLKNQKVVTVDLSNYNATGTLPTSSDIDSLVALPDPSCTNGISRMFGLKMHHGKLYAGVVCNGEDGGATGDLSATVYVYDLSLGTWSVAVSTFSLNYTRGGVVDANCPSWQPWINEYDDPFTNCRPSPMLSDIEFDVDGSMVLAFSDRYTFQKFTLQRDSSDMASESVVNGGDILRVYFDGTDYTLENNGTTIGGGGCGANGQGPGTGEFYCGEFIGTEHSETAMGAAAMLLGSGKLLLTVINPVNYNSGGVRLFDNTTGASSTADGYELYNTPGITFPAGNGYAVKGGGLGDIEVFCNPAPIEIGNSVWLDENGDGIRDAIEAGISDVEVSLFDLAGNLLWLDTTDASGNFYFSDTLDYNTDYYIVFGTDGGFNLVDSVFNDSLFLTLPNNGMGANADLTDSDAGLAAGIHVAIDGYPYIQVTTGYGGQSNNNLDIGFFECPTITNPSAGETICSGEVISTMQVNTNTMGVNSISYVYFTSQQTGNAMYTGGTLLSHATPSAGIAAITDQNLPANIGVTPVVYYIYAIANPDPDDLTCRPFQEIQITVDPASEITMGSDTPVCEGNDLNLTEGGGTATMWNWTGPNGFSESAQNPTISMVTEAAEGRYYLTVTDANGCINIDSIDVIIDPIPSISFTAAGPFTTLDAPVNLSATPVGGTFSGTGITDAALGTFDPGVAGAGMHTITYSYTDTKSCTNTAQIVIDVIGVTPEIGDFVWLDTDGNGIQDIGEAGIENVMVILYDNLLTPVDTVWTGAAGDYAFVGQPMGNYYLEFDPSTNTGGFLNLGATLDSVGISTTDSDVNPLTGQTQLFAYDPGTSSETSIDAGFFDCPVILNPSASQTICSGELVATLQASTNVAIANGISFVYFSTPQTAADSYVGGLLLGNVTPFGGNAMITDVSFPSNAGSSPINYYVYVVANPTPALSTCRPSQEIIVTVNPSTTATVGGNTPLCGGETLNLTETGGDAQMWLWNGPNSFSSAIPSPSIAGVNVASAGRYYVTITDNNSCTAVDSIDIVVHPLPTVTLNSAGPFCVIDGATNLVGSPSGGTFSGTGITDAALGTFVPGVADVGTHTITYSFTDANSCTNTATTDIIVGAPPTVTLDGAGPFCLDAAAVPLNGSPSGNGTYSGTGITDGAAGIFVPGVAGVGTHTISYDFTDAGGCSNTATTDIVVNAPPTVTINAAGPFCESDAAVTLVGSPSGGTFSGIGITDGVAGTFDPATAGAGTHTITYSFTDVNGCTNTATTDIDVNPLPIVSINSAGPYCETDVAVTLGGNPSGGTFSGTGITDGAAGTFDPATAGVGIHTISYIFTDANSCSNTGTLDIEVEAIPTASLNSAGPVCVNASAITLVGSPSGGTYSGTGITDGTAGTFNPSTAGVGTHTITYTVIAGGCSDMTTIDIIVNDLPTVSLNSAGPVCVNGSSVTLVGSPSGGTYTGTGITDGVAGTFDPATAGVGTHTISYSFIDVNGCSNTGTTDIIVNDLPTVSINAVGPYCETDVAVTLVGNPSGGTFSGTGITDGTAGTFDPVTAGVGTHTISYSFTDANSCSNTGTLDIEVEAIPTASLNSAGPVCVNASTITLVGSPAGGTYTGTGITDGTAGTFDPATAGVGTHTITYTVATGGCSDMTTTDIVVNDLPTVSLNSAGPVCINGSSITLVGNPSGGTYTGTGITDGAAGTFDPVTAGVGTHMISYSFTDINGCTNTGTTDVVVNDLPTVSINAAGPYCETDVAVNLGGNPSGGTFSGTGITDGAAGTFDPVTAGVGTHTISYSFTDANGCSNTGTLDIEVEAIPTASLNNAGPVCVNASAITLVGSPSGGIYSGTGITDGVAGTFDPATAGVGTHTITYTITTGGCSDMTTTDIVVNDLPTVSLNSAGPVCINGSSMNLVGSPVGGTFSGAGIIDMLTGVFDPATAGVGTHTISYSFTDVNGCTNTGMTDIVVNDLPTVSLNAAGPYCETDAAVTLVGNPSGGTFSGTGITDGAVGTFDPAIAGVATHTITYTFTDANGCTNTDQIMIVVNDCNSDTIGDFVWLDTNGNGVQDMGETGLENVQVIIVDANTMLPVDTVYTNNSGNFAIPGIPAGDYYLIFDGSTNTNGLTELIGSPTGAGTSTTDTNADPTTGQSGTFTYDPLVGESDIDAGFYESGGIGNFVWSDTNGNGVQDMGEPGLEDIQVILYDANTMMPLDTVVSNSVGAYAFTGLAVGDYYLIYNTNLLSSTYQFSPQNAGMDVLVDSDMDATTGQTGTITVQIGTFDNTVDGGFTPAPTESIGDYVWLDTNGNGVQDMGETGLENVQVIIVDANTMLPVDTVYTNNSGNYSITGIPAGDYYLIFDGSTNTNGLTELIGSPTGAGTSTTDTNADPSTGQSGTFTYDPLAGVESDIDAGFYESGGIGNFVWSDTNGNGVQDMGEPGLEDIQVILYDANTMMPLDTVVSNSLGAYAFTGLAVGDYYLIYNTNLLSSTYQFSPQNAGMDILVDSDMDATTGQTGTLTVQIGTFDNTVDAGFIPNITESIGDFVWLDDNGNGVQDFGESGIENVQVIIVDANTMLPVDTVYTNSFGNYSITGTPAGDYYLIFDVSTNTDGLTDMIGSPTGAGTSTTDTNADPTTGQSGTFTYDPLAGVESDIDAGFYESGGIGNFVWSDTNGNGVQDMGEPGLEDIQVILYDANTMMPLDTVVSNSLGAYAFTGLAVGDYYLIYNTNLLSSLYQFSPQNVGMDVLLDSDMDATTGQTGTITVQTGTFDASIDAGFVPVVGLSIGDFVWSDTNGNGIQDMGELGIEGVTITLFDVNTDTIITTTTTDNLGAFGFNDLPAGDYYLGFDPTTNTAGANYLGVPQDAGMDDFVDSDIDPTTGLTAPFTFDPLGGAITDIDAGFILDCPTAEAGPNVNICENTDAQLFATGGSIYAWTPTNGLSDPTVSNPTASPLSTTLYFVDVSDIFGCMSTDSILITVLPTPIITSVVPTDPTACDLTDGTITVLTSGGQTPLQFSIDGGMNFQASNLFVGLAAGNYSVVVANDDGSCETSPTPVSLNDNTVVCNDVFGIDTTTIAAGNAPVLCFPIEFTSIGDYEVTINGALYTAPFNSCTIDTMANPATELTLGGTGIYEMVLKNNMTCCRDTLAIAVFKSTTPDTISTITPYQATTGNMCADTTELTGDFSTIASCDGPDNGSLTFDGSPCVTYTPNNGFVGIDTVCLVVCDDFGSCDSTVLFVMVLPETCPDIITATDETVGLTDCTTDGELCIDLSLGEIGNYDITDNGVPYNNGIQACSFDTSYVYTYFILPGQGLAGPYTLNDWTVNGAMFSGAIPDMDALVDSMNIWDPSGNWILESGSSSILGGVTGAAYGTMNMTQDASGTTEILQRNISLIPIDTRLSFAIGSHEVVFMDPLSGCTDTLNVEVVCNCGPLFGAPAEITATDCNTIEEYCTPITFGDIVNYTISDNGNPYSGGIVACSNDPSFAAIRVDTGFHELIFTNTLAGCLDTLELNVLCVGCPDLLVSTATLDADDCNSMTDFCFGILPDDIANYTVTDNGNLYGGSFSACGFDTIQSYITIGFNSPDTYTLDSWPVNGTVFSTPSFGSSAALVDSMNVWDPLGNWTLNGLIISGGVNGSTYGNITVSLNGIGVADPIPSPQLVGTSTVVALDTGYHELIFTNTLNGCIEMVEVTVNCTPVVPCVPLFATDFQQASTGNCNDLTEVCLPAPIEEVIRYVITDNGSPYTGQVEGCDFDSLLTYAYLTLPGGGNTGPYTLDDWTVNGTTFSSPFQNIADLVDSMNVWDPTSNWEFDPTNLIISGANPDNSYSSMSITQTGTGAFTSLDLNTQLLAQATQLNLAVGMHELIFTNNTTGCIDSITVNVWCVESSTWTDTLLVGIVDTICVDTFELLGNLVSINNVCEDESGDFVSFDLIDNTVCVEVTMLDVGTDTACIVICDDLSICDTTFIYLTGTMDSAAPTAIADVDSTSQGQMTIINIQANDGTQNIDTTYISSSPGFGTAILDEAGGTITYTPFADYCNSTTPDSLTYVLCNSFGCDSTTVSIYVFCNTIEVKTGFSPNGDLHNETFMIEGLQAFPNNVLCVYNRWGNQVFRMEGYDNSWDGTWSGSDLVDGTYFYVLDDGEGKTYSGYVQIHR